MLYVPNNAYPSHVHTTLSPAGACKQWPQNVLFALAQQDKDLSWEC